MALDVLRRGVDGDVGTEVERAEQHRRVERVVDGEQDAARLVTLAMAATSESLSVGFAGVSMKTSLVLGVIAFSTSFASEVSTKVTSMPSGARRRLAKRTVPP